MGLISKHSTITQVLKDFGNEMQTALRHSIEEGGDYGSHSVTHELSSSINFTAKILGNQFQFTLTMADYYDFINKGVSGTEHIQPGTDYKFRNPNPSPEHVGEIKSWMNNRGLFKTKGSKFTPRGGLKELTAGNKDSQAFGMTKGIKKKGIKGSHFYDEVVTTDRLKKLSSDLTKAAGKDIQTIISNTTKEVFGKSI